MSDKAFNALERFAEKSASHQTLLGQMTQRFDPFSELIRNVELGMAKADCWKKNSFAPAARFCECLSNGNCWKRIRCWLGRSVCEILMSTP